MKTNLNQYKKLEKFIDILVQHEKDNPKELYPPAITPQFALDCLTEALLGTDYYIVLPCGNTQGNTIILDDILRTYSPAYRKLIKKTQKELRSV